MADYVINLIQCMQELEEGDIIENCDKKPDAREVSAGYRN
jgi:hypothetical protein